MRKEKISANSYKLFQGVKGDLVILQTLDDESHLSSNFKIIEDTIGFNGANWKHLKGRSKLLALYFFLTRKQGLLCRLIDVHSNELARLLLLPPTYKWKFMKKMDFQISSLETNPRFQNQGLASYLVLGVVKNFISKADLGDSIWMACNLQNLPSIKIAEKSGFRDSGLAIRTTPFGIRLLGGLRVIDNYAGIFTMRRAIRGLKIISRVIFQELPRGLDFSNRKRSKIPTSNGYAMTTFCALSNINDHCSMFGRSFLDIGSGKGGNLISAHKLGCIRVAGIEKDDSLFQIAERNLSKIGLLEKIEMFCSDALDFDSYDEYDYFFLFNPFPLDIYERFIDTFLGSLSTNSSKRFLVIYGNSPIEFLKSKNRLGLVYEGICPSRFNRLAIYEIS
jgi:16S rRNA G966 N2-methylase RsmD